MSTDSYLKHVFSSLNLNSFWLSIKNEYPILAEIAMKTLLPFVTTYLCESSFSTLTVIKTKYRASLKNIEIIMRPAVTNIKPRFDKLCKEKQPHPSH